MWVAKFRHGLLEKSLIHQLFRKHGMSCPLTVGEMLWDSAEAVKVEAKAEFKES